MNKDSSIGIFDSGIGGLTILQKIRELLPRENIIYYGDWKNNPYSEKSRKDIQEFSVNKMCIRDRRVAGKSAAEFVKNR